MAPPVVVECHVRPAHTDDIPQIRDLFSYYMLNTALTFRVTEPTEPFMLSRYYAAMAAGLPYLVATSRETSGRERVLGYAHASPFQAGKHAYGHSVEITIFLEHSYTGKGIGTLLMRELLARLKECRHVSIESGVEDDKREFPVRKVFAIMAVDEDQEKGGLGLRDWYVNKWGFEECGRFKGVGEKRGRDSIDTLYLEKHLQ